MLPGSISTASKQEAIMLDAVFLTLGLALIASTGLYARALERL